LHVFENKDHCAHTGLNKTDANNFTARAVKLFAHIDVSNIPTLLFTVNITQGENQVYHLVKRKITMLNSKFHISIKNAEIKKIHCYFNLAATKR